MNKVKKILCMVLITMMTMIMVIGCGKTEEEKMSEKYSDAKEVTLVNEKTKAKVYLPKKDVMNNDNSIMLVKANGDIVSDKSLKVLNKYDISQVGLTYKNNDILQYQLINGTYTKKSLSELGEAKTFTINEQKYAYVVVKNEQRYTAYVSIKGDKEHSVLLIFESFDKITVNKLKGFTERVLFLGTETNKK